MPKARKLPSGNWRVQVIDHYEYIDGKKKPVRVSFTDADRRRAEQLAADYLVTKEGIIAPVTVHDSIRKYIDAKKGVLSPSTISAYESQLKNGVYKPIEAKSVRDLKKEDVQIWISWLVGKDKSAKYIKNVFALFQASVKLAGGKEYDVTLPRMRKPKVYTPTDAELVQLMDYLKDKPETLAAVLLAAFGSMRRSEVCALTGSDFDGQRVTINKAMVRTPSGDWTIKTTKTADSERVVTLPAFVIDTIKPQAGKRILSCNPDGLTSRFKRAIKYAKIENTFTFHALRHYYVSIAHALGISEAYTMKSGGWKTDNVMKRNYRAVLTDYEEQEKEKLHGHFAKIFAHDFAHDSRSAQ